MFKKINRIRVFSFFILFAIINLNISVRADNTKPIVAYAKVDKTEATIGDIINFQISLDYDKSIKLQIPDTKKYLSDFEVIKDNKSSPKNIDNRIVEEFSYSFQVKNIGSYTIQPIEIKYTVPTNLEAIYGKSGVVKTSKIFIDIKTVLKPEDKNKEIEDIKPLEKINVFDTNLVIFIVIIVIVAIIGLYFLIKKLRRPEKDLLAHELAYKQLDALKKSKLDNQEETKEFYFNLSEIVRRYLKNRFEISALEKTSQALNKEIQNNHEIDKNQKIFINSFLEKTDFYKFTDAISSPDSAYQLFDNAYNFVNETKKIPEPEKKN
ncbi:MAG: hypothetical protein H7263_09660 [Candidatus Sericytochromatia bacterium]|nr:hypothetical protein [Candidatus Sericytochromatia bacterium]